MLFREAFSQPCISFFHLLVNGFSVISLHTVFGGSQFLAPEKKKCHFLRFIQNNNSNNNHFHHHQLRQMGFLRVYTEAVATSLIPLKIIIPEICAFIIGFSYYTKAVATSLIPLETIIPEIYAFIIGFSYTVWTKMMYLTG